MQWLVSAGGSLRTRVFRGGVWLLMGDAGNRVIGLVRAAVLARLLMPRDFGLAAIGLLTAQWLDYFSQSGFNTALIQKDGDVRCYYRTCWTVEALRGAALSVLLFLAAPLATWFFHDTQAAPLVRCMALVFVIRGLSSPALVGLRRDLNFRREVLWRLSGSVGGAVTAIVLACLYRNAWALVISVVVAQLVETIFSYWAYPFRPGPRIDTAQVKELLRFGRWICWNNMVVFPGRFLDSILVGKLLGTAVLGFYQLASQLAFLPASQIGVYLGGLTLPAFTKLNGTQELRRGFLRTITLVATIVVPVGCFVGAFSLPIVRTVLGTRWDPIVPVVQVLAWAGIASALTEIVSPLIIRLGHPDLVAFCNLLKTAVLLLSFYPLVLMLGSVGMAVSLLLACLAGLLAQLAVSARLLQSTIWQLLPATKAGIVAGTPFLAFWLFLSPSLAASSSGLLWAAPATAASLGLLALVLRFRMPRVFSSLVRTGTDG